MERVDGDRVRTAARAVRRIVALALILLGTLMPVFADGISAQTEPSDPPVYIVSITGTIDLGLAPYLARVIEEAEDAGSPAVILEIDTPGGRLDAVLQMQDTLLDAEIRTIAFVNRTAFSAGALIAIAAEEIYMVPGAVMGAATPVDGAGETASEKIVSAVRKTFKTTAEVRGRDPLVAEAMVDPDIAIEGLVASGELLTLTTAEAQTWGYADGVVANRAELLQAAGLDGWPLRETSPVLAERVVRFITDPVVAGLLITAAILLIIGDFFVEGFGVVGAIGLALLAIFFWGHMLAGLAGWEDAALVALGLVLIGVEVFVIPGFGVAGIAGIAALAGGFWLAMVGRDIRTPEATERAGWAVALALLAAVAGTIALLVLLPNVRRGGGLILRSNVSDGPAVDARRPRGWIRLFGGGAELERGSEPTLASGPPVRTKTLKGAHGTATTDLRPSGHAEINGRQVDVVTAGEYIAIGTPIAVVADDGYRCLVRRR